MRFLPVTVLIASATLLSAAPADGQSASGSARGSVRSTTATSGVPVRNGTTASRIPYANFDPFFQPRYGTVRQQPPRDGRWQRDGIDRRHRDRRPDRYYDLYYDPYYYPYSYPVIYYQPGTTRVVEVHSEVYVPVVVPAAPTAPRRAPALESCAIVTVLQPDYRGYWKELSLPVAGAVNSDELQRVLNARIEEGVAFTLRDAAGETLEVPAGGALDRIVVDPCR